MAVNATVTRQAKADELTSRIQRAVLWAHGLDVIADELEAVALPVANMEDVRVAVVARLRSDAIASRGEVARLRDRLQDIASAVDAAVAYTRRA
jgi:hypothetical protein